MKKRTSKLLSLLLTLAMVLGMLPAMSITAFAEGTREEVDTIKATAIINVPSYGEPTNYPAFTVTEGSPAYIAAMMTHWEKKNTVTGKWDNVSSGNTFTEGTWRLSVQVRIDGEGGKTHKLSEKPRFFVNEVEWQIESKSRFDDYHFVSLAYFHSQEYEVTSSTLPQMYDITVTNGVAKNVSYIDITKAKPGDKVVLLADDRRDEGFAFEKWVVTGATVDAENNMTAKFIMPEGNVTAEATYIPCDISIKAVKLTLGNYAVGKKASDISVKIITPDVVDFSYGDTYRCYDEDGVALGGSYVLCYLEGETVKRLGTDELIKEGVEYFLEVHIKSDEGYTFLGLKEENVTLDGTAGVAMFMQPNNAVYSFMLTPLGASHTHTYGTEWKSDAYKHWHECSCGAKSEEAAHTAGEWIIDTPATATTSGTKHKECTVCGYTMTTETIPATGSGGGGGSSVSTYSVTVGKTENGSVSVSPKSASKGDTVTITVTPDKGYVLETLTVLDKNDKEIKITEKNGKYTFTMPASKVTVKATFMDDNTMLNYFVDVKAGDYFYDAVLWAVQEGITSGTDATHFSPNASCTRAQIVTFLWRAAGSPEPKNMSSFTDVPADSYYAKAVAWAVENGITKGTSDTTFTPNAKCTRAQIVTFLWRSQKSPASDSVNPFTDVAADAYYNTAVLWAAENGITGGTSATTFSPNNDCTRAQIVTFLFRCLGK